MSTIEGTICPALRASASGSVPLLVSTSELQRFESVKYLRNTFDRTFLVVAAGILMSVIFRSTRKSNSTWRSFCSVGFCAVAQETNARRSKIVFILSGSFPAHRLHRFTPNREGVIICSLSDGASNNVKAHHTSCRNSVCVRLNQLCQR